MKCGVSRQKTDMQQGRAMETASSVVKPVTRSLLERISQGRDDKGVHAANAILIANRVLPWLFVHPGEQ